jgi:hypothetical protein
VLEADQVSVSLSHYCPTAAALLFRSEASFELVLNPKAFPDTWPFEGLDARTSYPPFLRPGVLLGFDGLRTFEESVVRTLGNDDVRLGLARIERAIETIRDWTPSMGTLPEHVRTTFERISPGPGTAGADPRPILLASIPGDAEVGPDLPDFRGGHPVFSATVDLALRRYIASRLIAGWVVFQAEDLGAVARYLRLCFDTVMLFEAARPREESELDCFRESIRNADLWIVHHCDPERLAANLG